MSQRGFTLLEVVIATMVLAIVLGGIGTFFVSSARIERNNDAQTYLQRQATIIVDQMTKQIAEAAAATMVIPCLGGVPDSLQVTNSRGTYCFHRDVDGGTGFVMDTPAGGHWNLLSGAPVTLTTASGACPGQGGFCPSLVVSNGGATVGVAVTLRLRFQFAEASSYQIMTFATTIAARN